MSPERKILNMSQPREVSMDNSWFEFNSPNHFWMKARMRVLIGLLTGNNYHGVFLDIGCGSGQTMVEIEAAVKCRIDGADLDEKLLLKAPRIKGKLMILDVMDEHPSLSEKYDLILLLDVLEHVNNDTEFLKNTMRLLKPGGVIIINVPALQSMYSRYDSQVGHKRRYTILTLRGAAEAAGLTTLTGQYWGITMVPLLLLRKLALIFVRKKSIIKTGFSEPSERVGQLLNAICRIEHGLQIPQPFGTSVMSSFKKEE